jgi:hypothetical protein
MVTEMASILRLAEALDRSHQQVVQRLEFEFEPGEKSKDGGRGTLSMLIYIRAGENWEPETWALKEKKTMFERVFNMRLNFEVRVDTKGVR